MFGVAAGHEGSRLLVPHGDEANAVRAFAQGFDDGVDAVADQSEDIRDLPADQRVDENIRRVGIRIWGSGWHRPGALTFAL
jgi:hypothetical protein